VGDLDIRAFLRCTVGAGQSVAAACHSRQWASRDLESLERAISRSVD
jgi:hypothetical protein